MTKLLLTTVAVFLAFSTGCGYAVNDRDAEWCIEDGELYTPAVEAAEEWRERSGGEVNFSFVLEGDCSGRLRIRWGRADAGAVGHMDPDDNEIVIDERYPEYAHRVLFLHEFGHYLTGPVHSDDIEDVMHGNGPIEDWVRLTDADVARLDWPSARIKEGWD